MTVDVVCAGHSAYDIFMYLDNFPAENTKSATELMLEAGGGPAGNAAYLLSKWGIRCAYAGLVGDDTYGRKIVEEFREADTDLSMLEVRGGHPTPFSVILVNRRSGSRTIINRRLSGARMDPRIAIPSDLCPKVLLFDGHEPEMSMRLMNAFPGATSILDAGSLRKGTEMLSGAVDFLVCSERFALSATGLSALETNSDFNICLETLYEMNRKHVIVTLGEKGLIGFDGRGTIRMPAYKVNAVDTTAAGDIFHGAFAYCMLKNMNLSGSLRFASMAAAISVTVPGGRQSIPDLQKVRESLEKAGENSVF